MTPLTSALFKEKESENLRILELLPNLSSPLAVKPGIPSNFIALSPEGNLNLDDWIYWGPKEVLLNYFKNADSLKTPILRVTLSPGVSQTGATTFSHADFLNNLKKEQPKVFESCEFMWGNYPVVTIKTILNGRLALLAWVGLNDPPEGPTLLFDLIPPNDNYLDKNSGDLWLNFLTKTEMLTNRDYFRAFGQDLQEGYTVTTVHGIKLKMSAEKREKDGKVQVIILSDTPNVEFHYIDMFECQMGAKWKYGEPMVKVHGEITTNNKNEKFCFNHVTSIFYKKVKEFSKNKSQGLIFQKNCEMINTPN